MLARGWCSRHWQRWKKHGDPTFSRHERTPAQRLWEKVDKRGPDECWEWTGATANGYGRFAMQRDGQLVVFMAHRLAYELQNGPIPAGLHVLHRCDNPPCVNGRHLFVGTNNDNIADKVAKGRQPKPSARLTPDDVRAIRAEYDAGVVSQYELARRYGVTRPCIGQIVRRIHWKDVQ